MNQQIYKSGEIRSLKDIRYAKARITIETAFLQQKLQQDTQGFLHGGAMQAMGMGWKMFASAGKWMIGAELLIKGFKMMKRMWAAKKANTN